jgi:integrase
MPLWRVLARYWDWIKVAWTAALKDAKIHDFRFHDLRHTAATRLADAGTDAFTIAAILGHSTIQMSARYTHATDERKRRAVERMSGSQNPGHIPVTQLEAAS